MAQKKHEGKNRVIKMDLDRRNIAEVLQREIAITRADDPKPILATTNVAMCTVFYGWDKSTKVGFLCHLDLPFTTKVVPTLIKKLSEHSGRDSRFVATLTGGSRISWARSPRMRKDIQALSEEWGPKHGVTIEFGESERYLPIFKKIAFAFDTETGNIGDYPLRTTSLAWRDLFTCSLPRFVYEPERKRN